MRIVLTSILFVFCVISAIWAYQMNYETRYKKKQIIEINKKIESTLDRIDLLNTEWAFLNSPERLSQLADENFLKLNLIPLSKNNIKYSMDQINNSNEIKNGQ
tara:strand:+ start:1865 stop:2173 length:309 start_codon:yes stop_codon:yes gene_type:complete